MKYQLACLCECGHVATGDSRTDVGAALADHMGSAHDVPVDPAEAGELAIRRYDPQYARSHS
jgi:hypothetical protein